MTNLENLHLCKKKKTPWEQRRIRRDIVQRSAVQTFRSIARLQYYQNYNLILEEPFTVCKTLDSERNLHLICKKLISLD